MKSLVAIASFFAVAQMLVSGATISDSNAFNNGVTQATVATSDGYNYGIFPNSAIDDRNGPSNANEFYYADYQGVTPLPEQYMSLTNFTAPLGISALNFFDGDQYENGRVATQVTIYYSLSVATGNSLNPADYTALNGGLAYALPRSTFYSNNSYLQTDLSTGINYDTLLVNIPVGVKSILFDFGTNGQSNGDGTGYNVGMGFAEIQGIAATPEPSTWAMMFAGLAFLGLVVRRKKVLANS